jgi:hypothetical protein
MSSYEKEGENVAYCGIYCRLCDYYTGRIRDSARDLVDVVEKHGELKLFAEASKTVDYGNLVKGLEWLSTEFSPCVGGCKGGGGWGDCPIRKCCLEKNVGFCYQCASFPCETLKNFPKKVEELEQIKKTGVKNWVEKKLNQPSV